MSEFAARLAIQLAFCAAALRACKPDERDVIRFTGDFADLPDMTIGQILDQADALLGGLSSAPPNPKES